MKKNNIILIIIIIIIIIILYKPTNKSLFTNNYIIDGDTIVQKYKDVGEYSRFNYKTKRSLHWYNLQIIDHIKKSKNNKKILMLGVALGGMIIHMLDEDKNIHITGVDISDENFTLVRQYSDVNRLGLIKEDAMKYIANTNEKYNIIICDLFIGLNMPDFVLTNTFLNKIRQMLLPAGNFYINTVNRSDALSIIKQTFVNDIITTSTNNFNNLIFVTVKNA